MLLSEGVVGKTYKTYDIKTSDNLRRRLNVLGLTNGTNIEILNKNLNGSLIFKVRGTRFAISGKIAKSVMIGEVANG